jgi:ABC-type sugar transport system ATPase subunit
VAEVRLDGVTKRYGDVEAVHRLDLAARDGEFLVLLGPSGCGKTTALRLVAGLETLTEGTVSIAGRVVNEVEPKDRDVAMVFQNYALYPHLSVGRNIEFPLRQRRIDRSERARRVEEVASSLGLSALLARKPAQLSGGQRQRVALARAIVRQPQVFLMDEPLSNLDAALRVQTRADIVDLQQRLGTTTLFVTHDQVEAMTMGHRIAVMDHGVLQQIATPQELYSAPANTFVAGFLGAPPMNLVPATPGGADPPTARVAGGTVPLRSDRSAGVGHREHFIVGVRPEHLRIDPEGSVEATVTIVEILGADAHVIAALADGTKVVVRQPATAAAPPHGSSVRLAIDPSVVQVFDLDDGRRLDGAA